MRSPITRKFRELSKEYFAVLEQCRTEGEREAVARTFIEAAKGKKASIFNPPVTDGKEEEA